MESNGESFLRQLSVGSSPSSYYYQPSSARGSKRWGSKKKNLTQMDDDHDHVHHGHHRMRMGMGLKKRVMVVIDESTKAKQAMMWALTHIANKGDLLTLLHVVPPPHHDNHHHHHKDEHAPNLANSLGSLCKACKPEVEVEALVIQGPKLSTVISQVKKLEASVLVLSQSKPSLFSCCLFRSSSEDFVEQCINKAECLTLAVRKQSKGVGGYLVSTRWQKNFWLLA
ncbi:uncharacterized protein A4U43_C10F5540 [Asparagus officinalis]|uniref:UspA domain-containing protein n=1 Tax=Asparagus officinalis TaxID=4686 RepID=A0A5P1E177_ASPOF|nr:uncharacterized protein LOC109825588 [Asparagus officinalis]ONK56238.1 uncharacterized protein A4U43_C10F5540 [Asparagus officinalis]